MHELSAHFNGLPDGAVGLGARHGLFVVTHGGFMNQERCSLPSADEGLGWESVRREAANANEPLNVPQNHLGPTQYSIHLDAVWKPHNTSLDGKHQWW